MTSHFQSLKMAIVENLHLAKDGIHIYLGVACFIVAISIGRRSPRSYQAEGGPAGRQIQIEDPDGNPIELFQPASA